MKGIYITGGNAQGLGGVPWGDGGGGIYVDKATATLSDLVIYSNTAQYGGGIYLHKAADRVHDNRIHHNGVFGETTGGGMYLFLQQELWLPMKVFTRRYASGDLKQRLLSLGQSPGL